MISYFLSNFSMVLMLGPNSNLSIIYNLSLAYREVYIYIYIDTLLVCLHVCLFVSNKRPIAAEPIGPKFCARFINDQNFNN